MTIYTDFDCTVALDKRAGKQCAELSITHNGHQWSTIRLYNQEEIIDTIKKLQHFLDISGNLIPNRTKESEETMKTEDVVKQELQSRIGQVEMCLKSAKDCLKENDYLQCAIRLQMAAEQGQFSELLMNVFDSLAASNTASTDKGRRRLIRPCG